MSTLNFTTDIICKKACNVVVKQNCYQVLMQGGNLDLDCLLLWVCFRCLSMSWDRSRSWNKRVSIPGNCREFNWSSCCCRGPAAKHYLMSKQKENPGWQKLITSLFSRYMQTFLLFCWQWLEKYFIIKATVHSHFLIIIDLFFFLSENIWILLPWLKSWMVEKFWHIQAIFFPLAIK